MENQGGNQSSGHWFGKAVKDAPIWSDQADTFDIRSESQDIPYDDYKYNSKETNHTWSVLDREATGKKADNNAAGQKGPGLEDGDRITFCEEWCSQIINADKGCAEDSGHDCNGRKSQFLQITVCDDQKDPDKSQANACNFDKHWPLFIDETGQDQDHDG